MQFLHSNIDLKSLLSATLRDGRPAAAAVDRLVLLCRKIALVQFRRRARSAGFVAERLGLSLDDAAIDCIGDLFQCDDQGRLIQLESYFDGLAFDDLTEEELLAHLRRLVFAKVNQGLFRLYNEIDPGLARIIRNVKLAVQSLGSFAVVERFGETCLVPTVCEMLEHLPPFDRTELEDELRSYLCSSEPVPAILAKLSRCLRDQSERSRIVPLISVALVIRSLYQKRLEAPAAEAATAEQALLAENVASIVREECRTVRSSMRDQYVVRKRVDPKAFDAYFGVIEHHLNRKFGGLDGKARSFFDALRAELPGLSRESYEECHKDRLEYLSRQSEQRVVRQLRRNL